MANTSKIPTEKYVYRVSIGATLTAQLKGTRHYVTQLVLTQILRDSHW